MEKIKNNLPDVLLGFLLTGLISVVCNWVGYEVGFLESIPGLVILVAICIVGYIVDWIVDIDKISSVLWISLIAILVASPISPVSEIVIEQVGLIQLNAVVTPILGYTGVIIAKDWDAFKEVGLSGLIVSIFVIGGTFLISSLLGDFFMQIF